MKGLVARNAYIQYESPIYPGLKVMAKVKVFEKKVKLQGQGHQAKSYGMTRKFLSQGHKECTYAIRTS